jgi:poly(A) polymerase
MIEIDSNIFPKTHGAFIVGGSIRDLLLNRSPTDYDIAVLDDPHQYAQKIAGQTAGHWVEIGKADQKIIRVISDDRIFDISPARGKSIEEDLHLRDFTINAIAYEIASGRLIDCFGGCRDLIDQKIRMVSDDIFRKDPVRLIRAYRLEAMLDFTIEAGTEAAIRDHAGLIKMTAGERIREEFLKVLQNSNSHHFLCQMAQVGLLSAIFPELGYSLNAVPRDLANQNQSLNAVDRTLKAFAHLERMLNNYHRFIPDAAAPSWQKINKTGKILLKFAMLLHDIGQPAVRLVPKTADFQFSGCEKKSAEISSEICKRLRFSNRDARHIQFIISNQTRPLLLFLAHQRKTLSPINLARFFRRCDGYTPGLFLQSLADIKGKEDNNKKISRSFLNFALKIIREYFSVYRAKEVQPPLITGHDLIEEFGLTPSPLFKSLLEIVEENRLAEKNMTRRDALQLVSHILKHQKIIKKK